MSATGKGPRGAFAAVQDDYLIDGVTVILGKRGEAGTSLLVDGGEQRQYIANEERHRSEEPQTFARLGTDEAFALHLALAEHFGREAVSDVSFMRDTLKIEQGRVDRLIAAVVERAA